MRFDHAIMLSIAVFIGFMIMGVDFIKINPIILICAFLVPVFIEMGAFALNDYLDYKVDVANARRDRPLVSGDISHRSALYIAIVSFLIGIFLAYFLPTSAFIIAISFSIMSIAYDIKLKELPFLGNAIIASSMGIPFIFANAIISDELLLISAVLFGMAFVFGLAREIIKSVEDLEGDVKIKQAKTLPVIIGIKNSMLIAGILQFIFMVLAALPFLFILKPNFISTISLVISYFIIGYSTGITLFYVSETDYKEKCSYLKKALYLAMIFGLAALGLAA